MLASELSTDFDQEQGIAAGELFAILLPFFLAQTEWIIRSIDDKSPLVPELIGLGFDPVKARTELLDRMQAVATRIAERSALKTVNVITKPTPIVVTPSTIVASPTSPVGGVGATVKALPVSIVDAIKKLLDRLWGLPWWQPVAEGQLTATREIVRRTVVKHGPIPIEKVPKVKRKLKTRAKRVARVRSKGIAETESTTAVNVGKQEAGRAIAQAVGFGDMKTWVTMADERVRPSHVRLHMKSIPVNDDFDVGGHPAPHPGWWELPIEQRIHCRCFLAYGDVEDDIEFPIPEELREAV